MFAAPFLIASMAAVAGTPDVSGAGSATRDANTGLVFGKGHAFWLTAPSGWVLDNASGAADGLVAVFYRVGESWKHAKVAMYVNTVEKGSQSFDQLIAADIERFDCSDRKGSVRVQLPDTEEVTG